MAKITVRDTNVTVILLNENDYIWAGYSDVQKSIAGVAP